jgi:uncharacterized membrane protein
MSRIDLSERAGRGLNAATAVYVLFLLAPFTGGLTALAGFILAVATRGDADARPREHLLRQGRLFWTGLLLALPVVILSWIGEVPILGIPFAFLGWVLGFLIAAWFVVTSFFGLLRLRSDRSPRG